MTNKLIQPHHKESLPKGYADLFPYSELTIPEVIQAATVGMQRVIDCMVTGKKNKHGERGWGWDRHIEGAVSEMLLAKNKGIYWNGTIGQIKSADVGKYEVRETDWTEGKLLLHEEDADKRVFILAVGLAPRYRFAGWIKAVDGKKQKYWDALRPGRPCYCVPQEVLKAMEFLPPLEEL